MQIFLPTLLCLCLVASVGGFASLGRPLLLRKPRAQGRCMEGLSSYQAVLDKIPLPRSVPLSKVVGEERWNEIGASLKKFAGAAPGGIKKQLEEQVVPVAKAILFKEKIVGASEEEAAVEHEVVEQVVEQQMKTREFFADMAELTGAVKKHSMNSVQELVQTSLEVSDAKTMISEKEEQKKDVSSSADSTMLQIQELLSVSVADEIMPQEMSQEWMDSSSSMWDDEDEWDRPSPSWMMDSPNKQKSL